ncbi:unnamed protein product, partial [Durusdinium trenchii]
DPWLKLETNKEGDVVISTDALRHNYQILMTALQFYGLEIAIIDQLTKEVAELFQTMGFVPDSGVAKLFQQIRDLKVGNPTTANLEGELNLEDETGGGDGGEEEVVDVSAPAIH